MCVCVCVKHTATGCKLIYVVQGGRKTNDSNKCEEEDKQNLNCWTSKN